MEDESRATWPTAYVNDLPDSSFLYVEAGGTKDSEGKTTPRSLRHFPYKDASGAVDMPHLRNALARIPQSNLPTDVKDRLTAKAQRILSGQSSVEPDGEERSAPPRMGYRAINWPAEVRAEADQPPRLVGHFARYNVFNEIRSMSEGHFLERVADGAFKKTFAENGDRIRVLFQHGKDPEVGEKPIATVSVLRSDATGPYYEAELLDGINPLVMDGLRKGAYGVSYRFQVTREDWEPHPPESPDNPSGLPERTIREAKVHEFGPVTFPADAGADVAVRSITDLIEHVTPAEPVAPSLDAEADAPHLEPERRDDPEPIVVPPEAVKETPPMSDEYVTRDEKAARVTELREEMKRLAVEHPGVLPDPEQERWNAIEQELETLEADVAAWDKRQARIAAFVDDSKRTEPATAPNIIKRVTVEDIYDLGGIKQRSRTMDEYDTNVREYALRSVDQSKFPAGTREDGILEMLDEERDAGEEGKGEVARRVLLTGSPVYRRAFTKYLRGQKDLWSPEESRAAALAVTGTTTTGGYAVPYVFDPTLLHIGAHTSINPYRAACRVVTISNGNHWLQPTVGAITAAYGTEAGAPSEGGPTFGQPSFTVQTAKAFASVSFETLQDRPDIGTELASLFGEAKDTLEEAQFTTGVGTTVYPLGMFTDGAFTNIDTATNDVTAITDMTATEADLPLRHRMRAAWFMSRSTQRQLEALDTTGYYFKRPTTYFAGGQAQPATNPTGNTGSQLLGYPVWEVPSAADTLTTDGAIIVIFGDPVNYVIVDRIGMNVEVVQHLMNGASPSIPNLQRGVLCYWRNTARSINVDGMRSLSVQ